MHNISIILAGDRVLTEQDKYLLQKENIIDGMLCIRTVEGIVNVHVDDITFVYKKNDPEFKPSPEFVKLDEVV